MYKLVGADQREYGPCSADEIRHWIAEGRANGRTLAQIEGGKEWKPLAAYPEFADIQSPLPAFVPVPGVVLPLRGLSPSPSA